MHLISGNTMESEQFKVFEDYAVYRPVAHVSLEKSVEMVTEAITLCRERGVRKLLVDTCGFTGFESPSLPARYFFMHDWSRAAAGVVCVAMVARAEMIDPEKFGVTVGRNNGLLCDVFSSEEEADAWLRSIKCNGAVRAAERV